jgi:hypothetical protein
VVTKVFATRYEGSDAEGHGIDELCAMVGFLRPKIVRPRKPRKPHCAGDDVVTALAFCCAVLDAPSGEPTASDPGRAGVPLRRFKKRDIADETAGLRCWPLMSPATMDRRLAP